MFKKNQRVVSRTEPDLGVGLIKSATSQGRVNIFFPLTEESRSYNTLSGSPIQRYILHPGDTAYLPDGSTFSVEQAVDEDGLYKYVGEEKELWEWELGDQASDLGTLDMFLAGQFSHFHAFDLRKEAWQIRGESRASGVMGFVGPRVTPMAHQLYIAKTVLAQANPRVLLSDEVGLGKTIEAGLIYSGMRSLGRAQRVLVLVPESLTHQWLAEMFRRFNELLTVLDLDRCQEEEASQGQSAFSIINRAICSSEFLLANPEYMQQALSVDWDLVIVDEAHHLKLPDEDNQITNWSLVKGLSQKTRGLLLLTATPRMYGLESQFSLLNLVDAERFNDFSVFSEQASEMKELAKIAHKIETDGFSKKMIKDLTHMFPEDTSLLKLFNLPSPNKGVVLRALVDRHGTGRVFFRNRRERLKGFPQRILKSVIIEPGLNHRMKWLDGFCSQLGKEKALIICSSKNQVLKIQRWFHANSQYKISVFHEDLSIVERDIEAAQFAQSSKTNILVCSEIGGEGRNFQFCHNLVLFDLPMHPDLVEQRIGRLDRIGQNQNIKVHTLWTQQSSEEVYFRWYHEGLNCFEQSWNGADIIFEKFAQQIETLSDKFDKHTNNDNQSALDQLIEDTKKETTRVRKAQAESVDVLMDINSFNEDKGHQLVDNIDDKDDDPALELFIKALFDHYGIQYKDFDDRGTIIVNGESLSFIENFPGISSEEDTVIAFDRAVALEREDVTFVSQDHQIAEESLSLLLDRNEGVAALCKWQESPYGAGALVEVSVVLQASGPKSLELDRYLPLKIKSFVVNHKGQDIENSPHLSDPSVLRELSPHETPGDGERMAQFINPIMERIGDESIDWATPQIKEALKNASAQLNEEKQRLEYLASVNPNMNHGEIEHFQVKMDQVTEHIQSAKPRIDGIRVIFTEARSF
ncbi:MAG: DEAD/DEAH box helicase family protein [Bdellovibrionaceae bacterium]|jgi:ATP-dependent helicase HepA|nr:DEAD/DEAH box helicase family protein [Pseudobdellovibrionaceae bacterium]